MINESEAIIELHRKKRPYDEKIYKMVCLKKIYHITNTNSKVCSVLESFYKSDAEKYITESWMQLEFLSEVESNDDVIRMGILTSIFTFDVINASLYF